MNRKSFLLSIMTAAAILVNGGIGQATSALAAQVSTANDYVNHPDKASIEYAINNKLMWLYGDGNFRPDQVITQADLIAGLSNVKNLALGTPVQGLTPNHWAKAYYERANKEGILNGIAINPNKVLTREEAAQIIVNSWQNVRASVTKKNDQFNKGASYVQFVTGYKQMKPKAGKFPNGVATSLFDSFGTLTRADLAYSLTSLKKDYLEVREAEKIADQMHGAIKVSGGYLTVAAPKTRAGLEAKFMIVTKSGETLDTLRKGSLKVALSNVDGIMVSVRNTITNTALVDYRYSNLPKLDRVRIWW